MENNSVDTNRDVARPFRYLRSARMTYDRDATRGARPRLQTIFEQSHRARRNNPYAAGIQSRTLHAQAEMSRPRS